MAATGSNQHERNNADGSREGRFHGRGILARLVRAISPTTKGDPLQHAAEADTANLEQIARELFLEIADCRRIQEQQRRARSSTGGVLVVFGTVMFAYCILRLWKASVTVLWTPYTYPRALDGVEDVPGGAGTVDDPVTRFVRFASSRHLLVGDNAEGWNELISFLLTGVLVLLQTRGFLVTITRVSRSSMIRDETNGNAYESDGNTTAVEMHVFSIPSQILSVLMAMLMGTYLTSSVILLRVNLPPRHRVSITAVLGGMKFSFYERWFDAVFLLSGFASAVTLLVLHLASRGSDADHHDDRHTPEIRTSSDEFIFAGMESSIRRGCSESMNTRCDPQGSVVRGRPIGRAAVTSMLPSGSRGKGDHPSARPNYSTWMAESRKPSAKQS